MKKKVKVFNSQYAQGGITQQDIQNYLMSMQQQPQVTEDVLVDTIYNELSLLGDDAGYVDQGYIDDLADKITESYGVDNDYAVNLVNEVYSTLAPSDLKYQTTQIAKGSPTPQLNMSEEQQDYQEDLTDENLEANVATYDDYYGDDTDISEMKFGGMTRKKFMKEFIRKAQEGMEQDTNESVIGNNDTPDGRDALVKGFESSVKKAVVKAVAKNQFDKMNSQTPYFAEGGFYDPNNLGDDEAYAHHLNLMAAANKDIFNQPNLTMAKKGREQRRAERDQRRVGRDVQKTLNNLPGLYPEGFNVYSMPGQITPDMSQLSQGMPPFTIEGERNIFGGLKNYKASFEGGLPVNFMAGMMMPGRRGGGLNMLSSIYGYPTSFYGQQSYNTPGQIVYEQINKEALDEVDANIPNKEEETTEGSTTATGTTVATTPVTQTIVPPVRTITQTPVVQQPIIPAAIDRTKFKDALEDPEPKPGKNYKEWQTKEGGKAISYEDTYTTGMFGTKHPARYQIVYKPDGSIDKKKSFVAVSQGDYGGTIYVPWDKQGTFMYDEGGMVMNPTVDPFGNLQKYVYGGTDPSVAELDGTNLVDPSDPYTRRFDKGGTQEEYQKYIDWYNESAPEEGMRRAAPQSFEEWQKENYPNQSTTKPKQTIVPGYNPQNAALAAQYMAQAMGNMPRTPFGSYRQAVNPFTISRGMVQRGVPMIAGTNVPFAGAFGPDARISEIYTDPRRFGKDALHVKFMVPGQEGPMLGMDWQQQAAQQKQEASKEIGAKDLRKTELDKYTRSSVKGLEDESRTSVRAGERATRGDIRRGMRQDPNAFYEGEVLEGMVAPMSDEEYMARVAANRKDVLPKKVKEPTKSKEEKVKSSKERVSSSTQVSSSKPDKVKKEKDTTESQYKSRGAALRAALDGVDPYDVKMYGPDYIKKKQVWEEASKQGDVWKKMPKESISEMEAAHNFFDKELNPRYKQMDELRDSYQNYDKNTSDKNKRKNYRQFKKEAKSKAQEGGFVPNYMAYGGTPMYPDGGFVYNNPVDNRTNPVMSDQDFFSVNTNQNTIPDYLEWQSTPDQEVDVEYRQKNKINLKPKGLMPFIGRSSRNLREGLDNIQIDKFNTQNLMTSAGREQADELVSQGMYDINSGKEINAGFEGIVGAGKGVGQQTYFNIGGQYNYEEGGEYDLTDEEIQALIDAGVDITLLDGYED